jgi:hypothetical protein
MPWGGDWYLWCLFSLHYDVGYFAEPMVYYRRHDQAMTNEFMDTNLAACATEDIALPWIIKKKAEEAGCSSVVRHCRRAIAAEYARCIATRRYRTSKTPMTLGTFEESLQSYSSDREEQSGIRANTYAIVGDFHYWQHDFAQAREFYGRAISKYKWMPATWIKYLLLGTGAPGIRFRASLASLRNR